MFVCFTKRSGKDPVQDPGSTRNATREKGNLDESTPWGKGAKQPWALGYAEHYRNHQDQASYQGHTRATMYDQNEPQTYHVELVDLSVEPTLFTTSPSGKSRPERVI